MDLPAQLETRLIVLKISKARSLRPSNYLDTGFNSNMRLDTYLVMF